MRFIDLASDGGCSKKASAEDLESLIGNLCIGKNIVGGGIDRNFPDCGLYSSDGTNLLATVDTLFPMVPDAGDFGRIVVNHVANDVYASFGIPKFALAHLGVPHGLSADSDVVLRMMHGAIQELSAIGVSLVGGHTLAKQSDLSLGFSIVGVPMSRVDAPVRENGRPGDAIFLTKPLGSSVASLLWKLRLAKEDDFGDVLDGLKQRNDQYSIVLHKMGIAHCTDVTGFGLLNHVHRLLLRISSAAQISVDDLPIYKSVGKYQEYEDLPTTSLYYENASYASKYSNVESWYRHPKSPCMLDAQVAGGLVFVVPSECEEDMLRAFLEHDLTIYRIGQCIDGDAGGILLR